MNKLSKLPFIALAILPQLLLAASAEQLIDQYSPSQGDSQTAVNPYDPCSASAPKSAGLSLQCQKRISLESYFDQFQSNSKYFSNYIDNLKKQINREINSATISDLKAYISSDNKALTTSSLTGS